MSSQRPLKQIAGEEWVPNCDVKQDEVKINEVEYWETNTVIASQHILRLMRKSLEGLRLATISEQTQNS